MNKIIKISVFGLLLAFAACGGGGGGGSGNGKVGAAEAEVHGSCYMPASGSCNEFVGTGWTVPGVELRCGAGLADPNPCPSENVIGRCNLMEMPLDADQRIYYYVSSAWQEDDIDFLRDQCVNITKGTFDEL